jgi:hypothetical protein
MNTKTAQPKTASVSQNGATLNKLIESTNIPESLVRAVIRQFGGWESFTESAEDVSNHGIDGGFHGFIYYADTEPFAKRNRKAIAEMASAQASEFGTGVIEMIRGFGCFRNSTKPTDEEIGSALYAGKDVDDGLPVLNALAWYAGEEVCRAYVDLIERD